MPTILFSVSLIVEQAPFSINGHVVQKIYIVDFTVG